MNDALYQYALDTENPETNFALAFEYEKIGQTASAITYYLRAADRTDDTLLAYECLLHMASCFNDQKNRNYTVRGLYQHAINVLPKRPEAYFLYARYDEWNKMYADGYTTANLGLTFCDFDVEPLSNVDYPGKYGLIFEKAVCSYWWGKSKECRELFFDLRNNYELDQIHKNSVEDNILRLGFYKEENEFNYDQNFDWSDLSYEDKVTIEREVVHEQVYRFWRDVKENDVVLDIGASVGAYTISILDQKPSKIYCVEPSKKLLKILSKNCSEKLFDCKENPIITINKGIVDNENDKINIFDGEEEFSGITFKKLINEYSINHIDFMKIDCEGGEYSVFKEENMNFLLNNVKFIAMEVHLNYEGCRKKFKNFRDKYLIQFNNYKVMSCTRQNIEWGRSLDIKDKIFDDNFIDNYNCEFMIYMLQM